jgi:Lar family restriction alleviation protein
VSKKTFNPCPFCGGTAVSLKEGEDTLYAVQCTDCNALGPREKTPTEAAERWGYEEED